MVGNQVPGDLLQHNWLVVSTHLKNISQNWNLPQRSGRFIFLWNHHLVNHFQALLCPPTHMLKPAEVQRSSLHGLTDWKVALALTAFGGVDGIEGESFWRDTAAKGKQTIPIGKEMITWLDTILGRHTPRVPYVILRQKHAHETGQGIWHTHKRMPHTCNKLVQLTVTVSHVFFCGWSIVWSHGCNARVSKGLQDDQVGKKVACPAHMRWWSSAMAHIHSCFAPNCSIFSLSLTYTYTTTARNQWPSRSLETEDKMVCNVRLVAVSLSSLSRALCWQRISKIGRRECITSLGPGGKQRRSVC